MNKLFEKTCFLFIITFVKIKIFLIQKSESMGFVLHGCGSRFLINQMKHFVF